MVEIEISNNQLLRIGDTVLFAIDNLPTSIQIGTPGENRRWDFTTLQSPYTQRTVWEASDPQKENELDL